MKPHPLSEIFPAMEGTEYAALVADIEAHGQIQPLVMYQGKILDGRNRARACEKLGIKPKTTDYRGTDPLGYVLSLNLSRRHLSESQRAMVAARVSELSERGGDRRSAHQEANLQSKPTIATAAKALNVSPRSTRDARKVVEKATPALRKAVERDEIPVSTAAKLVDEPASTQKAAADGGKTVAREIVATIEKQKQEAHDSPAPFVRTLGLEVPPEIMARIEKEQGLIDKMSKQLAELKRTYSEYEKLTGVEQFGTRGHLSSSFRTAINELNVLRGRRPASICPHCKLLPELQPTCACCRASGFIGETELGRVEKCLLAEGDDAGVWAQGKWRTLASMRGDDF
jgi:hypothetical protein